MMRSLVSALIAGLLFVAVAQAKLNPAFSVRVAEPGDTVELDVGPGTEQFLGELRIFLVSLEGDDRPQVKIGELGTPGEFGPPPVLRFEVPDVPAGEYTLAIWVRGYQTGTWANALESIDPLLMVRAAQSDGQVSAPLWGAVIAIGGLGAGLVAWALRRCARRVATDSPRASKSRATLTRQEKSPARASGNVP